MSGFEIEGKQGFIRIEFEEVIGFPNETSYLGGYDVKGKIDIKSGNYYVKNAEVWFSTGQVLLFFVQLQQCYRDLKGSAAFQESDNNKLFELVCNKLGQVNIRGCFQELSHQENVLQFEFESEQSYLTSTLQQLKEILNHYGDSKGVQKHLE